MAFSSTPVQSKSNVNTSGTTISTVFDSGPTSGNLMVGTIASNDADCTNPSGWSTAVNVLNAIEDDFARIFYKVAGGGESATVTLTAFTGNSKLMGISEWSGNDAVPSDKQAFTGRAASVSTLSSGTTATTSQADELAVALVAVRDTVTIAPSADNSFTLLHSLSNASTFNAISAYKILSATGAIVTNFSWTGAGTAWAMIATFKASGGGPPPTVYSATFSMMGVG